MITVVYIYQVSAPFRNVSDNIFPTEKAMYTYKSCVYIFIQICMHTNTNIYISVYILIGNIQNNQKESTQNQKVNLVD